MPNEIVALAQQYAQRQAQAAIRRVTVPAASGLVAAVFFLFAAIALFAALFFWLAQLYGPVTATLVVAGVAVILGLLSLTPIMVKRRPPPPPAPGLTAPHVASLLAQTAPSLARQRPLLTAILLAGALGFMALSSSRDKKR